MNLNSIFTIFVKDVQTASKDYMIMGTILILLAIAVGLPALMNMSEQKIPVAVYDQGSNGQFIDYLRSVNYYNLTYDVTVVSGEDQLEKQVSDGKALAAIAIPQGFVDDVRNGKKPALTITIDPAKTRTMAFTQTYKDIMMGFTDQEYPIAITMKSVGNSGNDLLSATGSIPLWVMMTAVLIGILILPITLAAEKEKKTLDAILVSPTSENDIVFGKLLFGLSLTLGMSLIVLYLNHGFTGNVAATLAFTVLGASAFTGLGLLVASFMNNYYSATTIPSIVALPLFMAPMLGLMSDQFAAISKLSPSTHMYQGISDAINGTGTQSDLIIGLAVLLLSNLAIFAVTGYVLKKRRITT